MKINTSKLLDSLINENQLDDFFEVHTNSLQTDTLTDLLNVLLYEKQMTIAVVHRKTYMNKSYIYKIFSGEKKASRDYIIQIAIAMNCSLEEVNGLLKAAEYSCLYPRIKRDSVFIYGIIKDLSLIDINELLIHHHEKPLFIF